MISFKLKVKRKKKRHEKQQWAKTVQKEIEEETADLSLPIIKSDKKLFPRKPNKKAAQNEPL